MIAFFRKHSKISIRFYGGEWQRVSGYTFIRTPRVILVEETDFEPLWRTWRGFQLKQETAMEKIKSHIAGAIINHLVSGESDQKTDGQIIEGECSKVKSPSKPLKLIGTQVIDRYHEVKYLDNIGKCRIVLDHSAFWYCLEDVCAILGLTIQQALEKCDLDNGVPRRFAAKSGTPIVCINKFNLLDDLLPASNINQRAFTNWLNHAMESINNGLASTQKKKSKARANTSDGRSGPKNPAECGRTKDGQDNSGKDDLLKENAGGGQSTTREGGDIVTFYFESHDVRVVIDKDGTPMFVAADLLSTLSLYRKALERLDDDEKDTRTIGTPGGPQKMVVLNESGLNSLILASRKPEAQRFKRWVIREVLQTINPLQPKGSNPNCNDSSNTIAFHFDSHKVRTAVGEKGEPLFCAADVCDALGYANSRKAIADHCNKAGVTIRYTNTISGARSIAYINEGCLYRLIIKSRKPEAKRFEAWVCDEVLPAIRKTGSYSPEPASRAPLHISFDAGGLDIRGFEIEERNENGAPGLHIKIKPSHSQGASMNKKDKVIRAIDLGYGRVKFINNVTPNGYECASFPSIVGRASGKNLGGGFFAERNNVTVQLKGLDYEVGEDSILAAGAYGTRTLDFRYVYSDNYQILMRGALKMMNVDVIDVLVLGAPVSNFEEASKYLKSQFVDVINLDGQKQVEIKRVIVLPQPLGGYAWYGKSTNGYTKIRKQLSLVVDPGYFTFDWMVSRGAKFDTERSGSHAAGMSALIRSVARELSIKKNSGTDIDSLSIWDKIDRFFYADEPFTLKGHGYDLQKHLQAARSLIDNAVDALTMRVGNANDIENVILIGGGARHYASVLRERLDGHAIKTVDNPGYANVQGFQFVGEEMSKEVK